jgi:hypothetical protein
VVWLKNKGKLLLKKGNWTQSAGLNMQLTGSTKLNSTADPIYATKILSCYIAQSKNYCFLAPFIYRSNMFHNCQRRIFRQCATIFVLKPFCQIKKKERRNLEILPS